MARWLLTETAGPAHRWLTLAHVRARCVEHPHVARPISVCADATERESTFRYSACSVFLSVRRASGSRAHRRLCLRRPYSAAAAHPFGPVFAGGAECPLKAATAQAPVGCISRRRRPQARAADHHRRLAAQSALGVIAKGLTQRS